MFEAVSSLRGQLIKNASLANYTSWRVGGPADYLYIPADLADMAAFMEKVPAELPGSMVGVRE